MDYGADLVLFDVEIVPRLLNEWLSLARGRILIDVHLVKLLLATCQAGSEALGRFRAAHEVIVVVGRLHEVVVHNLIAFLGCGLVLLRHERFTRR